MTESTLKVLNLQHAAVKASKQGEQCSTDNVSYHLKLMLVHMGALAS